MTPASKPITRPVAAVSPTDEPDPFFGGQVDKTCKGCGGTFPPFRFRAEKRNRDGLMGKCRDCDNARCRAWSAANPERKKQVANAYARKPIARIKAAAARKKPERTAKQNAYSRAYLKQRREREGDLLRKREKARRERDAVKYSAREMVKNAVRTGRLKRCPCEVCGSTVRIHGHHDDYSRPLDVRWLCPLHHRRFHLGVTS